MTFTTLASGSTGNAALVSCGDTHILLDAGISGRRIAGGLKALGTAPEELSAILITHEHSDHVSGLRVLSKKAGVPIYATSATCQEWYRRNQCDPVREQMREQEAGTGMQIGSLWVESFPTPTTRRTAWATPSPGTACAWCCALTWAMSPRRSAGRWRAATCWCVRPTTTRTGSAPGPTPTT